MAFELHPILEADVSPRKGLWYVVADERGAAPAGRVGAAALQLAEEGRALLCGGASPTEGALSDLYLLKINSDSVTWETLPSKSLPPRYEHTLALRPSGRRVFVFGGAQETGPLGDVWTCRTDGGEWCEISEGVRCDPPGPRTHHSSSCVWRDKMVIFSGGDSGTKPSDNSLFLFDMVTHTWLKPSTTGDPPSPRQGHILAVVGDTLYVHGGMTSDGAIDSNLFALHLEKLSWSKPELHGSTPSPALAAHSCAVIGSQLYTFGGLTSAGACASLYCFNTDSMVWDEVEIEGAAPPSRLDHAMATITLNLHRFSSPSHKTSPNSHSSHLTTSTSSAEPSFVTVLAPETVNKVDNNVEKNEENIIIKANKPVSFSTYRESVVECCAENGEESREREGESGSSRDVGKETDITDVEVFSSEVRCECTLPGLVDGGRGECVKGESGDEREIGDLVTALLVFGGMDTSGHVHNDCFIIVPP